MPRKRGGSSWRVSPWLCVCVNVCVLILLLSCFSLGLQENQVMCKAGQERKGGKGRRVQTTKDWAGEFKKAQGWHRRGLCAVKLIYSKILPPLPHSPAALLTPPTISILSTSSFLRKSQQRKQRKRRKRRRAMKIRWMKKSRGSLPMWQPNASLTRPSAPLAR